ncbi:hypothetical protein METSMIALI_01396 [Methanobrevibacter smithii DSM 2375]|uniref:Uncharacterized protein n=1 Tax=Methanobrevibacter smithii DSM 2375 TaxID=483214 RepID=B9AG94_METSM|nr:hypothetical protein METSMIALI_01396 [Methanobrevibacter smithii DSM 2375]
MINFFFRKIKKFKLYEVYITIEDRFVFFSYKILFVPTYLSNLLFLNQYFLN